MTEVYTHYTDMKFFMTENDISSLEVQLGMMFHSFNLKSFHQLCALKATSAYALQELKKG